MRSLPEFPVVCKSDQSKLVQNCVGSTETLFVDYRSLSPAETCDKCYRHGYFMQNMCKCIATVVMLRPFFPSLVLLHSCCVYSFWWMCNVRLASFTSTGAFVSGLKKLK